MIRELTGLEWLDTAQEYADRVSGCTKVKVGAVIVKNNRIIALGANRAFPADLCKTVRGCRRVELYGDNAKEHRLPADCRAIHSEIDAIATAGEPLTGATIYVTRYPCEACARAIVASGIICVVYGREQSISEETYSILQDGRVNSIWRKDWKREDTKI